MSWNYRIVKHRTRGEIWYGLHEVYYNKKGEMNLWAPEPEVVGDSVLDLVATLAAMIRDATKDAPVLKEKEMPGNKK